MSDLSSNQRKLLAVLADRDHITVSQAVDALKAPRPTVKQALQRLVSLRLIRRSGKGRGSEYALQAENEIIDRHEQKVIAIYKGQPAFAELFRKLEKSLKKSDFYWSFAFRDEYLDASVAKLLAGFHKRLARKKVEDLSIAHESARNRIVETYKGNRNIRFRFTKQEVPVGTIVLKDRVINLVWGGKPIAIEIFLPTITSYYRKFFVAAWNSAVQLESERPYVVPKPGNTPIVSGRPIYGVQNLFIKDESLNPTHTFKDRLAYEMIRPTLEAILAGQTPVPITFGSISYGNTAKAMGYYADAVNAFCGKEVVRVVAFVPPKLSGRTFGPDTHGNSVRFSAIKRNLQKSVHIVPIDLKKKIYRPRDLERIAREYKLVIGEFTDITEGLDRPAYVNIIIESIEQQFRASPDYVIVPFGAGILANEIIDYVAEHKLHTKVIPVSSGNPETIAVMLYGPIWVDTKSLREKGRALTRHEPLDRKGHKREPYIVYNVSDADIRAAMRELAKIGISAEPSGASGIALLKKLKRIDPSFDRRRHSVLVINTGNGLLNYTR